MNKKILIGLMLVFLVCAGEGAFAVYDHDFITTCNWTNTGTYTLRAYRGSSTDVVTSYSLFYRKKGDAEWTETTNGEVVIDSNGEWEIGNDWNKSGNDVLTHSYYGINDINSCTDVTFNESSLGITIGNYFLYNAWKQCANLASMPSGFQIPTGITTVGNAFLQTTWSNCVSLTSMPDGFQIPTGITTVGAKFLYQTWFYCTGLTSFPDGFDIPSGISTVGDNFMQQTFSYNDITTMPSGFNLPTEITGTVGNNFLNGTWAFCASLTSMPTGFNLPTGITTVGDYFLASAWYTTSLTSMPAGFNLPTGITTVGNFFLQHTFRDSDFTSMPVGFQIPTGITGSVGTNFMDSTWNQNQSLETMPSGFDIPNGITSVGSNFMFRTWYNCSVLDNNDYTEPITFEFTTGTDTFGGICPIVADSPIVGTKETPVEIEVNRPVPNTAPTMVSVDLNEYYGKTGDTIKVTANTPADVDSDSLSLYCHTSSGASSSNHDFCEDTGNASPYTDVSCVGTAVAGDGNHSIYCVLSDGTDDSSEYSDIYASDNTAPVTTDDHSDGWLVTPYYFTLSPSDSGSGISATAFRVDSGDWNANTIVWVVTDGNYQIDYNSIDTVGNVEVTNTIWTALDANPPTTTSAGYTDYAWTADSVTVTLTCNDGTGIGCDSTQYRLDENPSSTISMGAWQAYTVPFDITTDGNWAIDFNSTDTLGNTETPNREHILVSNPQFISDGLFWKHNNLDANFSFQLDENTWFYADWNIQTYSTIDSNAMHWMVWSQETNDTNHWKRSTLGGDINGWNPISGTKQQFDYQDTNTNTGGDNWFFRYSDFGRRAGSGGFITEQARYSYFEDNTHNTDDLRIYRKNLVKMEFNNVHIHAGHQTEYAVDLNLQFNSSDPNQQIVGVYDCNSDYLTGNPTTNNNCYLAGTISSTNPQSESGYYSIHYATDSTGVFPNGTVPTADRNIVLYSDNTLSHSISVSAIVSDSSTKVHTSVNTGGSLYNGTAQARMRWIHEDEPTAWYYFFTYHIQETGQDYNVEIQSYTITIPPNQPPGVQINGITDDWRHGTIDVNGACSDENIATMTIDLNIETQDNLTTTNIATGLTCLGGHWHTLFDTTTIADGNWELKATATDDEGLTGTAYADTAIDNSPPAVYIHSCDYSDWNSTNQTCSITCQDNGAGCNAATIGYRLDSNALDSNSMGAWQTGTSFSFSADGKWRADFNATDLLGNSLTDYNSQMIKIDKTNPTLSDHQYATEVLTGDDSTPTFSVKVTDTNALASFSQAKGCWIDVYKNSILVAQNQYDDINADGYCEYTFGSFPLSEDHWGFVTFKGTDNADNNSAPLTTATYNYNQEITDTGGVSPGGGGGGGATFIEEISQLLFSIIAPSPDKTIYVVLPKNSTKTVTITLENDLTDRTVQVSPTASVDLVDFVEFDTSTLNLDANAQNSITATFSWAENYALDNGSQTIDGLFLFTTESKQETIPVKLVLVEENIIDIIRNTLKQNLLLTIIAIMLGLALTIIPNTMELNPSIKSLAAITGILFTITIIALYLI